MVVVALNHEKNPPGWLWCPPRHGFRFQMGQICGKRAVSTETQRISKKQVNETRLTRSSRFRWKNVQKSQFSPKIGNAAGESEAMTFQNQTWLLS